MTDAEMIDFLGLERSDDESEGDPLPSIVLEEMDRRTQMKNAGEESLKPPSGEVVDALRRHFLSGEADFYYGGFLDCMEAIGATPSSQDPLVYDCEYNPGMEEVDHDCRVRLLRYKEYIEYQASKGVRPGDDWTMSLDFEYSGGDIVEYSIEGDEDLTDEQLLAFGEAFTLGFYYYANNDNVLTGRGFAVKSGSDVAMRFPPSFPKPKNSKKIQCEINVDAILGQCKELSKRYEDQQRPLGPKSILAKDASAPPPHNRQKKKKGKKNRRGKGDNVANEMSRRWGFHSEEIASYLHTLLVTMERHFASTNATADVLHSIADVLVSATRHDPDVAKAIVDGKCGPIVIDLQSRALNHAKASTDRQWWDVYALLTDLLGQSVYSLLTQRNRPATEEELDAEDDSAASSFFFETLVPVLLPSIESDCAQERASALHAFQLASSWAPHKRVLRLVGSKKVWATIESTVRNGLDDCALHTDEAKTSSWDSYMKHCALGNAATLLRGLCKRALSTEKAASFRHSEITPTALAAKMVKRGVVPLLIDIAKADLGYPSVKSMEGLANISRVKDCRTIIFQDTGGMDMLRKTLLSKDGSMVSPALLLIAHLLWDVEWISPLSSIQPELELTSVRWGLFALDRIVKRAGETRKTSGERLDRLKELVVDSFKLDDGEEKERVEQEIKEETQGKLAKSNWLKLEMEGNRDWIDYLLGRCVLLLSASCKLTGGIDRLIRADGLSLLSSCLDCPIVDTHTSAAAAFHNTMTQVDLVPGMFLDPTHFIRAAVVNLHRAMMANNQSQQSVLLLQLSVILKSQPEWVPYFEALPPPHWDIFRERTAHCRVAPRSTQRKSPSPENMRGNVNEKCARFTGKLRSCHACGKLETKRGDLSYCSRCSQVSYCSKECQVDHWHKGGHKAECKRLRKEASG